jgi:hypothetical protein
MGAKVSAAGASGGGGLPVPANAYVREDGVITAPPVPSVLPGPLAPAVATLEFGDSIAVNATVANVFNLTLENSDGTLENPTDPAGDGQIIRFRLTQGGSGSNTIAYGDAYNFGAGSAPDLSTGLGDVDEVAFEYFASLAGSAPWCYLGPALGF